jgi:predicted DNA-binding protein (MmcQ/YjbR family)
MNIEVLRDYCLSKKGVEETTPFGDDVLVYKVMGKMFALTSMEDSNSVNLKCDPDYAIELREQFPEIQPGYHMSKKHWNTISYDGAVDDNLILKLVDHSYDLVVSGLTKTLKKELENL